MARGFFGGSLFREALSVTGPGLASLVEVPAAMRLQLNRAVVEDRIGARLATLIRRRLKAGQDANGPITTATGRPALNRTGTLIRSIRYSKRDGLVTARGTRSDRKPSQRVRNRNFAVLSVQVAERGYDPLGHEAFTADLQRTAEREIARQITASKGGVFAELRRVRAAA